MNKLEYISFVSSSVHDGLEAWARNLLREAGIETTEVYGQFPPEGSVASHIVLFPYRLGSDDTQITQVTKHLPLMGNSSIQQMRSIPEVWRLTGKLAARCVREKFPVLTSGPRKNQPHPAPPIDKLPGPMRDWYEARGPDSTWVNNIAGNLFTRLPSLSWTTGVTLRLQYLVVVGAGARGTVDRQAPIAIQTLSVLAAGMQFQRTLQVKVPPLPYDPLLPSFARAIAETVDDSEAERLLELLEFIDKKANMSVTLIPGASLTNADFTGLMQALQRPLQPTLHLGVQMNLGGAPLFTVGITPDIQSDKKEA